MNTIDYKISFCTVCMNRSHHLKQTLPLNIFDNQSYKYLQFVILDYNSSDDLEQYVKTEMADYLDDGRLAYYKTSAPAYFNRSHSRNLVVKLAKGDVVVNLDADNYTGKNFAAYINREFNKTENIFLSAVGSATGNKQDVLGRICLKKADFFKIKGYDERMVYYGFEDYDLINRLEFSGLTNVPISNAGDYLTAIAHPDKERLSNEYVTANSQFGVGA